VLRRSSAVLLAALTGLAVVAPPASAEAVVDPRTWSSSRRCEVCRVRPLARRQRPRPAQRRPS